MEGFFYYHQNFGYWKGM